MTKIQQVVTKHLTLLLFIGLAWGQVSTSESHNDKSVSDKLIQSFRSDMGKFYTMTYYGEFLGQEQNKVYFKPMSNAPLKLVRLKEVRELIHNNKVLIKNGRWKIKPEGIKSYKGTFINSEGTSAEESSKYKKRKSANIMTGCGIISAAALAIFLIIIESIGIGLFI